VSHLPSGVVRTAHGSVVGVVGGIARLARHGVNTFMTPWIVTAVDVGIDVGVRHDEGIWRVIMCRRS